MQVILQIMPRRYILCPSAFLIKKQWGESVILMLNQSLFTFSWKRDFLKALSNEMDYLNLFHVRMDMSLLIQFNSFIDAINVFQTDDSVVASTMMNIRKTLKSQCKDKSGTSTWHHPWGKNWPPWLLIVSSRWAHGDLMESSRRPKWAVTEPWLSCDLAVTEPWSYWRCSQPAVTSPWLSCDLAVTELRPSRDWAVTSPWLSPSRDHWAPEPWPPWSPWAQGELTVTIYFLMGNLKKIYSTVHKASVQRKHKYCVSTNISLAVDIDYKQNKRHTRAFCTQFNIKYWWLKITIEAYIACNQINNFQITREGLLRYSLMLQLGQ